MTEFDQLCENYRNKDRRALSRLLTLASQSKHAQTIRETFGNRRRESPVIAITGSAGVGKSSLIGRLVELARQHHRTVAVLACDPESPLTGGALLGDRIRMAASGASDVFIRSLAARSGQQALAENVDLMAELLSAFGFQMILLETVGAGQGDTVVREVADVLVLLVQPHAGDELQWEKAGLLEVADVVVVNKSDLPGAAQVKVQLENQLSSPDGGAVPVLAVSTTQPVGLPELWQAILLEASRRASSANAKGASG